MLLLLLMLSIVGGNIERVENSPVVLAATGCIFSDDWLDMAAGLEQGAIEMSRWCLFFPSLNYCI